MIAIHDGHMGWSYVSIFNMIRNDHQICSSHIMSRWAHGAHGAHVHGFMDFMGCVDGPFSGPGERSRESKTGNLQEIAVRSLWDHFWDLNVAN